MTGPNASAARKRTPWIGAGPQDPWSTRSKFVQRARDTRQRTGSHSSARPIRGVQVQTKERVQVAFTDQGYTGQDASSAARETGASLQVIKLPDVKRGFVLLPRRWVVERSFGWLSRFRRLARDCEPSHHPGGLALHVLNDPVPPSGHTPPHENLQHPQGQPRPNA